jgi:UDPglucose 6-dehydrogenase
VEAANDHQKHVLTQKIVRRFGDDLKGRRFAMWGLAFKPNTDDMREAPSLVIVADLVKRGATVTAYDPIAVKEARRAYGNQGGLSYADTAMGALEGADALVIATEWREFRSPDFGAIKSRLRHAVVFDGRNMYDPALPESFGLEYHAIGRATAASKAAR